MAQLSPVCFFGNSEESGDYESEESGDMPHFDMLVGADPYQEGSGPLLGATVYRDYPEELVKENSSAFPCNQCESVFDSKMDIMKHLKAIHKCKVAKCRNFEQGNCNLPDLSCWFVHDEEEIKSNLSNHINNDHEQVFQKAQEKTPPDHIVKIMDLIGKLTIQMDQLEKRTMQQ